MAKQDASDGGSPRTRPTLDLPDQITLLSFDPRQRAALALRLAGYSEAQVEKLLARGEAGQDESGEQRRAA